MSATRDLPFAQGEAFDTLDAYLAFLERRGATGVPWYRKVGPDLYELMPGRGRRGAPARFTRAALMRRFGFEGEGAA